MITEEMFVLARHICLTKREDESIEFQPFRFLFYDQVYYLERVADMINLPDDRPFLMEAVVRCVELDVQHKIKPMSQDLVDSCKGMNKFWRVYIFPYMSVVTQQDKMLIDNTNENLNSNCAANNNTQIL